jgi:hypothetical protein
MLYRLHTTFPWLYLTRHHRLSPSLKLSCWARHKMLVLGGTCPPCLQKISLDILRFVLASLVAQRIVLKPTLVHIYQPDPGSHRHGIFKSLRRLSFQAFKYLRGQAPANSNPLVIHRRMLYLVSLYNRLPMPPSRALAHDPGQLPKSRQTVLCRRFSQHPHRCYAFRLHNSWNMEPKHVQIYAPSSHWSLCVSTNVSRRNNSHCSCFDLTVSRVCALSILDLAWLAQVPKFTDYTCKSI